jgi:predicted RNA binding protein YcfA (HicA-like mRNA interferase family)
LSKLPVISGRELVKILGKIDFAIVGRKGSHVRMKRQRGSEF